MAQKEKHVLNQAAAAAATIEMNATVCIEFTCASKINTKYVASALHATSCKLRMKRFKNFL